MQKINNSVLTQIALVSFIILLLIVICYQLAYFIPGVLGAITLYILSRDFYFYLVEKKGWKGWIASLSIILITFISVAIPLWLMVEVLIPQINSLTRNTPTIISKFNALKEFMASKPILENINLSEEALIKQLQKIATYIPMVLNGIAAILANVATAFFILYFMQINGRSMERRLAVLLPFTEENNNNLWKETNMMVRSNALGIPLLGLCQGLVAVLGYWVFGVDNFFLWGMITGVASLIPVLGTMVVWIPICIIQFATGNIGSAIGLTIYCTIAVGGIDNILRFTILKKIGDVHPLITVFGVILGLNMFGIMGLIFGPLLLSYFIVLTKIYRTEFGRKQNSAIITTTATTSIEQKRN